MIDVQAKEIGVGKTELDALHVRQARRIPKHGVAIIGHGDKGAAHAQRPRADEHLVANLGVRSFGKCYQRCKREEKGSAIRASLFHVEKCQNVVGY